MKPPGIPALSNLIAFGDSTTAVREGVITYPEILAREFSGSTARMKIINAGVPKDTTRDAAVRFARDVLDRQPTLVIIQFGLNDSAVDVWEDPPRAAPRVPLAEFSENLKNFVGQLGARNVRIIMMTPNPMRWTPLLKELYGKSPYREGETDGLNVTVKPYVKTIREIASRLNVMLVDVYAMFEACEARKEHKVDDLLLDGMHPNSAGHRIVADALLRKLRNPENS